MHEQFANWFYGSQAWKNCRAAYAKSKGYMCERCRSKGLIVSSGLEVHHKVPLTPQNIHNEHITLDWNNLSLLCHACHAEVHAADKPGAKDPARRYTVDEWGNIITREGRR